MYTTKEIDEYSNKRPGIPVDGTSALFDLDGRVLIVKPNYKKGWSLVGGYREATESPLGSARREVKEETGLDLPPNRFKLLGVRYVPSRGGRKQYVQINFSVELTSEEIKSIRLQESELSKYRFVYPSELHQYADTYRIQALITLLQAPSSYLEAEKLP